MFALFRREKFVYKIITLAVLAAALFFVYRIIYAGIIALPYPKELLEPANIALTNTFIEGKSPYTLSALSWDVPGVNYDYPFLNSLIAACIAGITGCTAVTAHFFISLISILASGIIGFLMIAEYLVSSKVSNERPDPTCCESTTIAPVLAALLFMFCHFRFGYISAAPDDLGLLFLLLTSYAAVCPKIRNKPLWCGIGITICFYTKQYFVFVAAGIFIYMLFYSWKEAIKLFAWTLVLNALIAVVITVYWPLYWTKAFLFTYLGTAVGGGGDIATLIDQFKYLIVLFAALFIIIMVAAANALKRLYKSNERLQSIRVRENDVFALSVIQSIVMLAPLYLIGRNDGAFLSYFLQLWMPFITVVAFISFERMRSDNHENVYAVIYAAIALFTIYFGFGKLPLHILTQEEIANWQKAYEYTSRYSESGEIFYSRALSYDGFERQNGQWQCGHEGEVSEETPEILENAGIPTGYFPYILPIVDQNQKYRDDIARKASEHGYSLITFESDDAFTVFDEENCKEYGYSYLDKLDLQLGNMPYEVLFFDYRP